MEHMEKKVHNTEFLKLKYENKNYKNIFHNCL